jgi:anti-sigma regulatory factor (Ser/Thr protein kinase)
MTSLRMPFVRAEQTAGLRGSVADLLRGRPEETVQDVLLVVTELVDNVVQHTDGGGELTVECDGDAVRVDVHDRSRSFPRLQRPDLKRPGGRGLMLVAALAQTWGSRPTADGKVVWARLGPAVLG